jgi:LysM repeat protein
MVRRNPARYLAPIALAVAVAGTYLIVHANLTAKSSHVHHAPRRTDGPTGKFAKSRTYIVQQGDSLSVISTRTGVPVRTLEALNPNVDPNSLHPGLRLRLRQ